MSSINAVKVGGTRRDGEPEYIGPWTFQSDIVRHSVLDELDGRVLNACAGKTKLEYDNVIRNDINPKREADHHYDVCSIDEHLPKDSFDVVVFDPPFDQTQADEHYESMHARDTAKARSAIVELVKPSGKVLEFGWNMHSIADGYHGWDRRETVIFRRGPNLQPVFMTIDVNTQTKLNQ